MTIPTMDDVQIKNIFKQAVIEAIQEQKEFFSDLFANTIEDIALMKAIEEGEETETVSRYELKSFQLRPKKAKK
ncbi:MAG: hypothetical protein U9Q82_01215 [Chloroflexota bacterium]|nr:hypothetical protein [Chloroflexota bacterium]